MIHSKDIKKYSYIQKNTVRLKSCQTSWNISESQSAIDEKCTDLVGWKRALIPLELTAAASSTADTGSGTSSSETPTIIISNEERKNFMKIVKSLEDSGLLVKDITQTTENETKEQKEGFIGLLLVTLGENLLGNVLIGKEVIQAGYGLIRAGQDFSCYLIVWLILK